MKWSDLVRRARAILFPQRVESELDEELSFHLEMEARKHRNAGSDPDAARLQARIAFGGAEQAKEMCRDVRGTRWLDDFLQDFRFAFRVLRKDRGYSAAAITALAVGIGLNTALFTLFSAVVLKPLPVPAPASLVTMWRSSARSPRGGPFSFADYLYYRDHNTVFTSLCAEAPAHLRLAAISSGSLSENAAAEPLIALFVTANYFKTFGVRPVAGRDFRLEEDQQPAGPYPALLSDNYWDRRFGRDPAILGQSLLLSGIQTSVIGITPRDFMGTRPDVPDVWIVSSGFGNLQRRATDRTTLSCTLNARLKPSATLRQAKAEMSVLAENLRREYPSAERQWNVKVVPATRFGAARDAYVNLFGILQVAMALVLLIACSNVAGLLLGKAAARQREIAVRLSIGASRGRLVRQLVSEGMLMALIAGMGAFLVTWQALELITRKLSAVLAGQGGTIAIDLTPNLAVFFYILAVCIVAGISVSLAPALQTTRPDLASALKNENTFFGVQQKGRLRGWMVAAQIAVCLALLIGAGLLTSNSVRLLSIDPGFATRDVLTMTIASPQELGYSAARVRDLQVRMEQNLRAIPGVLSISFASRIPLGGNITITRVAPRRDAVAPDQKQFPYTYASQDYFQTLGLPLLRGRGFTAQEIATNAPVAVISDALAREFWPGGDAIGQRIELGSQTEVHFAGRRAPYSTATEIVGVARDVYSSSLTAPDGGAVYLPKPLEDWNGIAFVRVAGDPSVLAGHFVREIHSLEPRLPVSVETLQHLIARGETSSLFRAGAAIFGAIGLLGFLLAAFGIYSMVAYSVSQQTREIGIRMALGAQKQDVVRLLLASGSRWIVGGLSCGAAFGTALSRVLASQLLLEGRQFLNPAVILAVSAATATLALFAAWLPAQRAARLDPAVTLRVE